MRAAVNGVGGDRGFAVLVAMMGLLMISAIGMALVLGTSTESMVARNFRDGAAAMYAAEAVAIRAIGDVSAEPDWSAVVGGPARSTFFDGWPGGPRTLADGSTIDLTEIVNLWNCGKTTSCSSADMNATTAERPWGVNNPRWRIYACGRLADLVPAGSGSRFYVLLLAADDPSETDGDPLADGAGLSNPGAGLVALRGESFGPGGAHSVVELTVARLGDDELSRDPGAPRVRVVSWRLGR